MLQIANIYSVKNQKLYKKESLVMILAHLAKQGLYKAESFNPDSYIIMDNGLYEKSQVSTSVDDLVKIADELPFRVDELIVPDVLNELEPNIEMFKDNLEQIRKHNKKYTFMFVAQSKNEQELKKAIDFINQFKGELNLVVGISKLCPFNRASIEAIEIYKTCKFPIHFLGIKTTFHELMFTKNTALNDLIRSCDTSQLSYIAKNETRHLPLDIINYQRSGRAQDGRGIEGVDIDLENDCLDETTLSALRTKLIEQFYALSTLEYNLFVLKSASPKYDLNLALVGLMGEVGELADVVKKMNIYEDMSQFIKKYGMTCKDKLTDEIGDVLWQLVLVMCKTGVTLDDVMASNYYKLMTRHGGVKTSQDGGKVR